MKKILSLILATMLCLSAAAMAESVPSKTTFDMTEFKVTAENQETSEEVYLLPVNELTVDVTEPEIQKHVEVCNVEIEKLAAVTETESVETYFGEVKDSEGNVIDLKQMLEVEDEETLNVFEFGPVVAGGFEEECGKVTATMLFATPYEENEPVIVLIGIVTVHEDGTQTVEWTAFEGVAMAAVEGQEETYGCISVELTPEIVLAIQNGMALMAVVSK